jgi:hypothetical protein
MFYTLSPSPHSIKTAIVVVTCSINVSALDALDARFALRPECEGVRQDAALQLPLARHIARVFKP